MQQEQKAKERLNAIIKQSGLKDEIKKYMRVKLAEKLQNPAENIQPSTDIFKHRVMVSAVKDFLDKIGCNYTSSIFCSQSGYEQKMLQVNELKQLLNIQFNSENKSIVEHIFTKVSGGTLFMKNAQVQTIGQSPEISIQQKFAIIDLEFKKILQQKNHIPKEAKHNCANEKLWYQKQLARFKQFQAHKIKVKVGQEWRIKFQSYAQQMQGYYQRKLDKLRQRQKLMVEDLALKQKNLAEKISNWQASAKSRLELIEIKQTTITKQKGNLELERKKAADELKKSITQAKDKQRQYENLVLNVEKRISYEVGLAKLNLQQQKKNKEQQFKGKKKFVEQEYDKLMRIKDTMEFVTKQNDRLLKENQSIRLENQSIKKQLKNFGLEIKNKEEIISSLKEQRHLLQMDKMQLQKTLNSQAIMRKKREQQLIKTRKQLQILREKDRDKSLQQSSFEDHLVVDNNKQMFAKMARIRQQRKKQIQRFKLEL